MAHLYIKTTVFAIILRIVGGTLTTGQCNVVCTDCISIPFFNPFVLFSDNSLIQLYCIKGKT